MEYFNIKTMKNKDRKIKCIVKKAGLIKHA